MKQGWGVGVETTEVVPQPPQAILGKFPEAANIHIRDRVSSK